MPWSPTDLTGLIGWWDASVTASLSLTGTDINSIADQSGSGNNLTWVIAKPVYNATGLNALPTITLDAAISSSMQKTSFPMGTGNTLTVFYIGTLPSSGSQGSGRPISYVGLGQSNDYGNAGSFDIERVTSSTTQMQFVRNLSATAVTTTAYAANHRFIVTVSSAGAVTFYVDGVSAGTGSSGGNWITGGTFAIGKNASANTEHFSGRMSEFGIATGFSDATTVAQLDAYLFNKWLSVVAPSQAWATQVAVEHWYAASPPAQSTQTAVEMWASTAVRSVSVGGTIVGQDSGDPTLSWTLWQNGTTLTLEFSVDGTYASKVTVSGGTVTPGAWHHVAADKDATGKIRLYLDGVMVASSTPANSNFFNSNVPVFIGSSVRGGDYYGWLDEVRVTKGTARYASDAGFAVPTMAFPRMGEPVQPPLVSDVDGFYAPAITQLAVGDFLLPERVADDDAIPAATVVYIPTLHPALVASDDAIHAPSVASVAGPQRTLTPPLVADADSFLFPWYVTLAGLPGGPQQKLKPPPKHQDNDVIFAFASSKMTGLVTDPDTIRAPLVTASAIVALDLVTAPDTIFAPGIELFSGLRPAPPANDDVIHAASVARVLQPALVYHDDGVPAADVGWKVFADLTANDDEIYDVDAYSFYPLYPEVWADEETIDTYPFFVQQLEGGIPVKPREGTLKGSIKKGPTLIGSITTVRAT